MLRDSDSVAIINFMVVLLGVMLLCLFIKIKILLARNYNMQLAFIQPLIDDYFKLNFNLGLRESNIIQSFPLLITITDNIFIIKKSICAHRANLYGV